MGPSARRRLVSLLGANALGEVLEPGRVPDCYLGLRLDPAGGMEAAGVLAAAPAVLLHPLVPQPDGTVLDELVTGHPDRTAQELVFLANLVERRNDVTAEAVGGSRTWWTCSPRSGCAAAGRLRQLRTSGQ
jgi:hypothetical protein